MNEVVQHLQTLARSDPQVLTDWLRRSLGRRELRALFLALIAGCALYGFSLGLWRSPLQGLYVAVKMPCLVLLTLTVNGLINGLLGILLGSGLSFRQTWKACLMSFALFGLIVGSLSPVAIAMVLDAPPPHQEGAERWYRVFLLTHTMVIAFAGIVSNYKLLRLLQAFSGSPEAGWRTLLAWLAGNLFVGAQLSYTLRPFFGNPDLPVQFLRPHPFEGNFYEAVWQMLRASLPTTGSGNAQLMLWVILIIGTLGIVWQARRTARKPLKD